MKISDISEIGSEIISLVGKYNKPQTNELSVDRMLFGYLSARFTRVERQHHFRLPGYEKPQRIDFRFGGSNPIYLELAVRPKKGGGQLSGSQNISELRKLCRIPNSRARMRVLLLLDFFHTPLNIDKLKAGYDYRYAGRGKFTRSCVRVVYVHTDQTNNFSWSPYK